MCVQRALTPRDELPPPQHPKSHKVAFMGIGFRYAVWRWYGRLASVGAPADALACMRVAVRVVFVVRVWCVWCVCVWCVWRRHMCVNSSRDFAMDFKLTLADHER